MTKLFSSLMTLACLASTASAQLQWKNVDSLYGPLPASVHVYRTNDLLDGKPNIAYYVIADLNDRKIQFDMDTTHKRRLTPTQFYEKDQRPLVVVNTSFFSFATNQNLNVVIKDGRMVGYNIHSIPGRGLDTFTYRHPYGSAIGIYKNRKADIAWLYTDSAKRHAYAFQFAPQLSKNTNAVVSMDSARAYSRINSQTGDHHTLKKWKVKTAVGGGPVLVQDGEIKISNNEEMKFGGKAIDDKHPRTAMGYTNDNKLIILVIEGRHPGQAEGATLTQEAQIFKDLGCKEALNLDGGGSSCMLVNGKETIKVSDAGQRPVPAVFIIRKK